jgi:hypothetical protein
LKLIERYRWIKNSPQNLNKTSGETIVKPKSNPYKKGTAKNTSFSKA